MFCTEREKEVSTARDRGESPFWCGGKKRSTSGSNRGGIRQKKGGKERERENFLSLGRIKVGPKKK